MLSDFFNSSHCAYLELVRHEFMKSGRNFNIIVAIVLCLE